MRIVIALGGNALLKRGEPLISANQRANRAHRLRTNRQNLSGQPTYDSAGASELRAQSGFFGLYDKA